MMLPANDYVGIPYAPRGRTRAGLDCWGLVRLVYREQFGIDLPAGDAGYDPANGAHVARLFDGPARDEWHEVPDPMPGDVVLLRVLGYPSHIGIVLDAGRMLHARERHAVVIERLDAGAWKHRIVGFYRHAGRAREGVRLIGRVHPLRTMHIEAVRLPGETLLAMLRAECARAGVPEPLVAAQGHAWIEGEYIPAAEWASYRPRAGQRIEFRLLPAGGGDTLRTVLTLGLVIAMMVAAPALAGWLAGAGGGMFGGSLAIAGASLSVGGAALYAAGMAGMMFAGSMLINAIAPIRPPDGGDYSTIKPKHRLQGGSNTPTPYSPIPVVLGQHRYTPPGAAEPYVETEGGETYLRMVVCWGYGPLDISDVRIGDTPIGTFEEVQQQHLVGYTGEDTTAFEQLYGQDTHQEQVNIKLTTDTDVDRTIATNVDLIKLNFHFPLGLWKTPTEGPEAGNVDPVKVKIALKVKAEGAPSWSEVAETIDAMTASLPWCGQVVQPELATNGVSDEADWWLTEYGGAKVSAFGVVYIPLWCWTTISVDLLGNIVLRQGCPTDSKWDEPSARLIALLKEQNSDAPNGYERLALISEGERMIAFVCVHGSAVDEIVPYLDTSITGCAVTAGTDTDITVAAGTITRAYAESLQIERKTKEAFDVQASFTVPRGKYDVRVTLRSNDSSEEEDFYRSGNDAAFYRDCYWTTLTGVLPQKAIVMPTPLCMTAYRIKASNQLNSTVAGITGTVRAYCMDYDIGTSAWVYRHTRNPAAIFRRVLEGPMNPRPVSFAGGMDTAQIERWHNYCGAQGFTYDAVHLQRRPLLDVLRDICAAGRASPTLVNGLWSVVIDEPKPSIVQHFTPHNSWGFDGARALPRMPHALRIRFFNEQRGWQYDDRIVYDDGYDENNATLFEQIELPGITHPRTVYRFGRFHLAQLRLRPDTYTLNVDAEHLICTRGDRVRVTHDVPLWGIGSGRISAIATSGSNATAITVDEPLPMVATGETYQVRIRTESGSSLVKAIANPVSDGEYTTLTFVAPFPASEVAAGCLVLFGLTGEESVDLIVQAIEPAAGHTARIRLADYAPAVFDADEGAIPDWDSQITLAPALMRQTIGTAQVPTITAVATDESALRETADGWLSGVLVSFSTQAGLPASVTHVEAQVGLVTTQVAWTPVPPVPIAARSVWASARRGSVVRVRLRYVDASGYVGAWAVAPDTEVLGASRPPGAVTGLHLLVDDKLGATLDWDDSPEVDVRRYVIRQKAGVCPASDWDTASAVKAVTTSQYRLGFLPPGDAITYFVKARDSMGNLSATASTVVLDVDAPVLPSALQATVVANQITLQWSATAGTFPIILYEVRSGGTSWETATLLGKAFTTHFTRLETAKGDYTYRIKAVDAAGNASAERTLTVQVGEPPGYVRTQAWTGTLA